MPRITLRDGRNINFPEPPIEPKSEYEQDWYGVSKETDDSLDRKHRWKHHIEEYKRIQYMLVSQQQELPDIEEKEEIKNVGVKRMVGKDNKPNE